MSPEALALIEAFERRLERLVADVVDACFAPAPAPASKKKKHERVAERSTHRAPGAHHLDQGARDGGFESLPLSPPTLEQRLDGIKAAAARLVPPAAPARALSVDELLARQGKPTEQLERRLEKIREAPAVRTFAEGTIVVCERGDGAERLGRILENRPNGLSRVQAVDLRGDPDTYGSARKAVREWVLAPGEIKREAHTYRGVRGRLCYRTFDRATTSSPFPSAGPGVVVLPPGLRNVG